MKATEVLTLGLEFSKNWLMGLIGDLKGEELIASPIANGGNHALWVLGHITVSEAGILNSYVLGEKNPLEEWNAKFGAGSTPSSKPEDYPPIEEMIAKFEGVRKHTLKVLSEMSDEQLDEKSHADNPYFEKKANCFLLMISHAAFHAGQVADVRKSLGKKPLLA